MSLIEVTGFSYTYPGETDPVLKDITLTIEQGRFVVVTGPSGSGKSTLGKALAGFLFADETPHYSGKIIINGTDMTQVPLYEASQRVAYVQQNPEDQFCTLTVMDELAFGLENLCINPIIIEQRIDQALSIVHGKHLKDRELDKLSGGEKQKVAIASMLALKPDVLILDEPTSNLDPEATQNIFETLHSLRQQQEIVVIIIEHKLDQLMGLVPDIFTLEKGKLTKGLKESKSAGDHPEWIAFSGSHPVNIKDSDINTPILQVNQATIGINGHDILKKVNLTVHPGEFIALMGPNGSGKSTFLQAMMGFHEIAYGEIRLMDQNADRTKTSGLVRDVGYVFQNPDHQLFMPTVWREAILTSVNLDQWNESRKATAEKWLQKAGLAHRAEDHPQRLSYGEKRRLNVIASLLHEPQLLLIDELLIGQDPYHARWWMAFLKKYAEMGCSAILSIHHPQLIKEYCSRVVFLEEGEIVIDDSIPGAFAQLLALGYHAYLPKGC